MKEISLGNGLVALVGDEDYVSLSQWNWGSNGRYAVRSFRENGKSKSIRMHREIMNPPDGMEVDHINHNKLDNRRENLRICTRAENQRNNPPMRGNKTGYKGVVFVPQNNKSKPFCAHIEISGKKISLGYHATAVLAALAYDVAAKFYFGDYAYLNFP